MTTTGRCSSSAGSLCSCSGTAFSAVALRMRPGCGAHRASAGCRPRSHCPSPPNHVGFNPMVGSDAAPRAQPRRFRHCCSAHSTKEGLCWLARTDTGRREGANLASCGRLDRGRTPNVVCAVRFCKHFDYFSIQMNGWVPCRPRLRWGRLGKKDRPRPLTVIAAPCLLRAGLFLSRGLHPVQKMILRDTASPRLK
jgi:hypothetical protein